MWELLPSSKYIGEVGLDFKMLQSQNRFKSIFEELINRCNGIGNCQGFDNSSRASAEDVISIIGDKFNSKYILHWYSGSLTTLTLNLYVGFYINCCNRFNSESGKNYC